MDSEVSILEYRHGHHYAVPYSTGNLRTDQESQPAEDRNFGRELCYRRLLDRPAQAKETRR